MLPLTKLLQNAEKYYKGLDPSTVLPTTNTAYKWSFASKSSRRDDEALRTARQEVTAATYGRDMTHTHPEAGTSASASSSARVQGPTLPTTADLIHAREMESEHQDEERKHKRKRDKLEAKEKVEDMVGPKEVGKEGMLEKKRARREQDRAFRERGDEGLEADESTLMGGGDSFREHLAKRDAGKKRFETKTQERDMVMRERANAIREKEKACLHSDCTIFKH
ncbi:hypothetical protein AX17_000379 [Amanita inopinata Kibby_2008]|nr:hypothetical protein AX17_000379 [Amanita inopinata Kibby_2008]